MITDDTSYSLHLNAKKDISWFIGILAVPIGWDILRIEHIIMPSDPSTNHIRQNSTSSLPSLSSNDAFCDNELRKARKPARVQSRARKSQRAFLLGISDPGQAGP